MTIGMGGFTHPQAVHLHALQDARLDEVAYHNLWRSGMLQTFCGGLGCFKHSVAVWDASNILWRSGMLQKCTPN
jgi:hypothetical protein